MFLHTTDILQYGTKYTTKTSMNDTTPNLRFLRLIVETSRKAVAVMTTYSTTPISACVSDVTITLHDFLSSSSMLLNHCVVLRQLDYVSVWFPGIA